jgi:signal transduction histidine kinase
MTTIHDDETGSADKSLDERLRTLSHDLRSPLNAILGWTRILAVKRAHDPEIIEITERIERSSKAQLKILEDFMDGVGPPTP